MSRIYEILPAAAIAPDTIARSRTEGHGNLEKVAPPRNPDDCSSPLDLQKVRVVSPQLAENTRIVVHAAPSSPGTDRFRYLRMRLRELQNANGLKRLLITSPLPGDGKSAMALNVATVLAERGDRSVLLIDGDLHQTALAPRLGLAPGVGLAECLAGTAEVGEALVRLEKLGWYLLPAGNPPEHPTELLQSAGLTKMMQQLSAHFDWIIMDSPPVLPITDALALAKHANAILLVVRAGQTPTDAIQKTIGLLGRQTIAGVLLNGIEEDSDRLYNKYRGYYPCRTPGEKQ